MYIIDDKTSAAFTYYSEAQFDTRIKHKIDFYRASGIPVPDPSHLMFYESCALKLHISLAGKDFPQHREKLIALLTSYLQPKVLFQFKVVKRLFLESQLEIKNYIDELNLLRQQYSPDNIDIVERLKLHLAKQNIDFELFVSTQSNEYQNEILKNLNYIQESVLRFFDGDQFTLYIPMHYDANKLRLMILAIENYVKQYKLQPGKKSDAACFLTKTMNVRQEYLTGNKQRIDAHPNLNCNLAERAQIAQRVQTEIKNHSLYQYLFFMLKEMPKISDFSLSNEMLKDVLDNNLHVTTSSLSPPPSPASSTRRF